MNLLPPEMEKSTNMPTFVIFCLPKIVKIIRVFNIKKYAPRNKLQLITLIVLGILVYRRFINFIGQDQGTDKAETRENRLEDSEDSDFEDSGREFEIVL